MLFSSMRLIENIIEFAELIITEELRFYQTSDLTSCAYHESVIYILNFLRVASRLMCHIEKSQSAYFL